MLASYRCWKTGDRRAARLGGGAMPGAAGGRAYAAGMTTSNGIAAAADGPVSDEENP